MHLAGTTPWYEGVHTYYGFAIAAFACAAWIKYIWPWIKKTLSGWYAWRVVRDGRPAIEDVTPEVVPLPRRIKRLERITTRLDNGQKEIIKRQDEHATEVDSIKKLVVTIDQKVTKLFPNGENTNDPGDLLARTAKTVGAFLENPEPIAHDRREDDKT